MTSPRRRPERKPTPESQETLYSEFIETFYADTDTVSVGQYTTDNKPSKQYTGKQLKDLDNGPLKYADACNLHITPCPQANKHDIERNPESLNRRSDIAQPGRACWVDCDEGLSPEQLRTAKRWGCWVIESGSKTQDGEPRYHLWFPLDAPTDPRVILFLNIQLRGQFNGDTKSDVAAYLRIPTSINHKNGQKNPVRIVHKGVRSNSPEELAEKLGTVIPERHELPELIGCSGVSRKEMREYLQQHSQAHVEEGAAKKFLMYYGRELTGNGHLRHSAMMSTVSVVLRAAAEPNSTVNAEHVLSALRERFAKDLQRDKGRNAGSEFDEMVSWGIGKNKIEQKAAEEAASERAEAMKARLLTTKQLRNRPNPRYLIEDLLDYNTLGRSVGAPGAGKTFGALSMAMRVAQGEPWYGHRVRKGPVVYLVAEGVDGFKKRVWAWEEMFGDIPDNQILFLPEPVQVMEDPWKDFITVCSDIQPVMIVLDTQARITLGIEENANSDMGKVVQRLDSLRLATNAHVHLIHHTGHEQKRGRGASAVLGAVDTELIYTKEKAEGDGWIFKLENQKQKDSAEAGDMFFMPEVVELGMDEDERMMSSLVFHLTAGRPAAGTNRKAAQEHKANRIQASILDFLEGHPSCSMRQLRAAVRKAAGCGQPLFEQELASLERDGYVKNVGTQTNNKWVKTNKVDKHKLSEENN